MGNEHLIQLEQEGLALQRDGKFREAAEVFIALLKEQPDWEHGEGFYCLAFCQEELGDFDAAEKSYLDALHYWPNNPYFLGGYAAFQASHRDPKQAFETYLRLLEVERRSKSQTGGESITATLKALGKRIGLSDRDIANKLEHSRR